MNDATSRFRYTIDAVGSRGSNASASHPSALYLGARISATNQFSRITSPISL